MRTPTRREREALQDAIATLAAHQQALSVAIAACETLQSIRERTEKVIVLTRKQLGRKRTAA